jgi:hypothetical protein
MGNYILLALVFSVLSMAVPVIIQGPLIVGFHIFTMKRLYNRPAELADLFTGFNFFLPALIASLLIGLFVTIGTMLCIIPGLVVAAMYKFTYLFIVDNEERLLRVHHVPDSGVPGERARVSVPGRRVAGDDPGHVRSHHSRLSRDCGIRTADDRLARMKQRLTWAALLMVALFVFSVPAEPRSFCGFHWLTGRPCPLCGLTRGLFALVKGHWVESLRFNALSPLGLAMLVAAPWNTRWRDRIWVSGICAFAVYGLYRVT